MPLSPSSLSGARSARTVFCLRPQLPLSGPTHTRLSSSGALAPPPPAPVSLPPPPTAPYGPTHSLLSSCRSLWPSSDAAASGDHTDATMTLLPETSAPAAKKKKSQRPGNKPRTLQPPFGGGGKDQSAETKVEVEVRTQGAGLKRSRGRAFEIRSLE